jgi:hypothetical protein
VRGAGGVRVPPAARRTGAPDELTVARSWNTVNGMHNFVGLVLPRRVGA